MPLRFFLALVAAFLISSVASEARRAARGSGGGLGRERGLSQAETRAAGVVLQEAARGSAAAIETEPPTRRYSPDYYRVYHRGPTVVTVKKMAAAPTAPTPPPAPLPKRQLAPAPVRVSKAKLLVVAPKPQRIVPPAPAKPVVERVAVAAKPMPPAVMKPAPKLAAKPAPKPRPGARSVLRVAVMPADTAGTIYLPVRGKRAAAPAPVMPLAKKAAAPGVKPKRQLFR